MKVDFNKLKAEISLPDFLIDHFGWQEDKGSSRTSPKLKSPDGAKTIVVKKNHSGFFTYWDVHDDTVKGKTVLDFMQQHILNESGKLPTLREVGEVLTNYMESGKTVIPTQSSYEINNELLNDDVILKMVRNLKPLSHFEFLESRGIVRETLESRVWANVFRQKEHITKEGEVHINTCVQLVNQTGVKGISQRNQYFKGCLGSRFDTIASSNIDKSRQIDELLIGESIIDCVSHYQMNRNDDRNVLYVSTEGALTDGQINTINAVLSFNKIEKIKILFDNDLAGSLYTLKLLSKINVERDETVQFFDVNAVKNDKENTVYCEVRLKTNKNDNEQEVLNRFFPDEILRKYIDRETEIKSKISVDVWGEHNHTTFIVSFPYEKEILKEVSENLKLTLFFEKIDLEIPKMKDFNEDLKVAENYRVEKYQTILSDISKTANIAVDNHFYKNEKELKDVMNLFGLNKTFDEWSKQVDLFRGGSDEDVYKAGIQIPILEEKLKREATEALKKLDDEIIKTGSELKNKSKERFRLQNDF